MYLLFSLLSFRWGPGHIPNRGLRGWLCVTQLPCSSHGEQKPPILHILPCRCVDVPWEAPCLCSCHQLCDNKNHGLGSEAHLFTFWSEDVLWINEQTDIFKWTTDSFSGQLCRESKYFKRVQLLLIALWSQPANSSAVAVNLLVVQLKDLTDAISGWYNVP